MAALEKVQHNHDDWAASLAAEQGAPFIPGDYCTALAKTIAMSEWRPVPATAFTLPKRDDSRF